MPYRPLLAFVLLLATTSTPSALVGAGGTRVSRAEVAITVIVTGSPARGGLVGAALYSSPKDFPDASPLVRLTRPKTTAVADTFVFLGLTAGRYAVAAQHDLNSNGVVDRNFVGMPKEPWGVSRDIRHAMRAPGFEEAAFTVSADTTIFVRVAK